MPRVLVVDDNPEILLVVEAALTTAGFEVVAADSAEKALSIFESQRFDAAVLDVMMPRMSGFQLLSRLRQLPRGEELPVLFLSALTDAEARIQGLRLGADDYLGKPFASDELVLRVGRLIKRQAPTPAGLEGNLRAFPLASLVQSLTEDGQSGELEVHCPELVGTLVLLDGRLVAAQTGRLTGREAAIALVEAREGRFRFTPGRPTPAADTQALEWQSILLEAAWTTDELALRQSSLPSAFEQLSWANRPFKRPPEQLAGLPIPALVQLFLVGQLTTLDEAERRCLAAPARVRLALAWLIEQGYVRADEVVDRLEPEVVADEEAGVLLAYYRSWLARCPGSPSLAALTLVYDASAWSRVESLFARVPADWVEDVSAAELLLATGKGSLPLRQGEAELLAQVQPLRAGSSLASLDSSEQSDLVLWLGDESRHLPPRGILAQLEESTSGIAGVLVPTSPAVRRSLEAFLGNSSRWRMAENPPESLDGLLRLLAQTSGS